MGIKINNEYVYNPEFDYVTGKIDVVAYLLGSGIEVDCMSLHKGRYVFVFEKTDALFEAIKQFKMDAMIQAYITHNHLVRNAIYQAKKGVANEEQSREGAKA